MAVVWGLPDAACWAWLVWGVSYRGMSYAAGMIGQWGEEESDGAQRPPPEPLRCLLAG